MENLWPYRQIISKRADCCITTLITACLTILPTNNMTNEILKYFCAMKNLHSDGTSGKKTDFVPLQL